MEIINTLTNILHYAVSFVIIISVIVFIHEWGHFIVARIFGVKIDEFSIGFGKEIWGRTDSKGTRWKISVLPMGGFVKMHGDSSEASTPDKERLANMTEEEKKISFYHKPLWQKTLIVAAGPAANFILSIFIFTAIFTTYGKFQLDAPAVVNEVVKGGAAEAIGMQPGDRIIALDGKPVKYFSEMQEVIRMAPLETLEIQYKRGSEIITKSISPKFEEIEGPNGEKVKIGMIGASRAPVEITDKNFKTLGITQAVPAAVDEVYKQCKNMLKGLWQIITGVRSTKELGGPVKIMEYSGQSTDKIGEALVCALSDTGGDCSKRAIDGLIISLLFMAMISTMLGLVNLFPIPMLDGGHILFYVIEGITRRPFHERSQEWLFRFGFAFLISLMLYATYNDIVSFVQRHITS